MIERVRPRSNRSGDQKPLPFGPAPLLKGEHSAEYDELLLQTSSAVGPEDFIEGIWVRDSVDIKWDLRRFRRLKASLLGLETRQELRSSLNGLVKRHDEDEDDDGEGGAEVEELVTAWAKRNPAALKKVDAMLADEARSVDEIMALALV